MDVDPRNEAGTSVVEERRGETYLLLGESWDPGRAKGSGSIWNRILAGSLIGQTENDG